MFFSMHLGNLPFKRQKSSANWTGFMAGYSACEAVLQNILLSTPPQALSSPAMLLSKVEEQRTLEASNFLSLTEPPDRAPLAPVGSADDNKENAQTAQCDPRKKNELWRPW